MQRNLTVFCQRSKKHTWFNVVLNSGGGDIDSAITIGRLVRKNYGETTIPDGGKCFSACALIFIAGVTRYNLGELGLHRPYIESGPLSRHVIEKQVPIMFDRIKTYVSEMGITDDFYQKIVNTNPSEITIYKGHDSQTLVPDVDPTYDEITVSYESRVYGITPLEYRQRARDVEDCKSLYPDLNPFLRFSDPFSFSCEEAMYWGLSKQVYLERNAHAIEACWFNSHQEYSDEEQKIQDGTPLISKRDLSLVIRHENCIRNVMLGK
jgi:hypothetical protein